MKLEDVQDNRSGPGNFAPHANTELVTIGDLKRLNCCLPQQDVIVGGFAQLKCCLPLQANCYWGYSCILLCSSKLSSCLPSRLTTWKVVAFVRRNPSHMASDVLGFYILLDM